LNLYIQSVKMASCYSFTPLSEYNWSPARFEILPFQPVVYPLVASFFALAIWMSLELSVQLYFKFRRHHGLYFWSICAVSCGVALHATGLLLKLLVPGVNLVGVTAMAKIGWVLDTTGFSIVLYSRLNLVVRNPRVLRIVLAMIITNAFIFHTPIIVLLMGLSVGHTSWKQYIVPFEWIQVVGFTVQETTISGMYIWKTAKFLKAGYDHELRKVVVLLITVQAVVVLMDLALITIDGIGYFTLKAVIHPFSYAVKLKLEFAVLNLLLGIVKKGPSRMKVRPDVEEGHKADESPTPPRRRMSVASMKSVLTRKRVSDIPSSEKVILKQTDFEICWQAPKNTSSEKSVDDPPIQKPAEIALVPSLARQNTVTTITLATPTNEEENSLEDVERQYLGRYGLVRGRR
jgi:hypothetical protein